MNLKTGSCVFAQLGIYLLSMKRMYYYDTPIGKLGIAEERGLITNICIDRMPAPLPVKVFETDSIKEAYTQILEYLDGARKEFDLPINISGDKKMQRVLASVIKIPYGTTVTYKDLGLEHDIHPRAIGTYMKKNPVPIIIPCHRVISSDGGLTGYIGGVKLKQQLLDLESNNT